MKIFMISKKKYIHVHVIFNFIAIDRNNVRFTSWYGCERFGLLFSMLCVYREG